MSRAKDLTNVLDGFRQIGALFGGREESTHGTKKLAPEYLPLRRRKRHENHVVLITSLCRLTFRRQYADDLEGHVLDTNRRADRFFTRIEQVFQRGLTNQRHPSRAFHIRLGKRPAA